MLVATMPSALALFVCFSSILSTASHAAKLNSVLGNDAQWWVWKLMHGKNYTDEYENNYRRAIWRANLKKIERHNNGNYSFTLAMNHLGDLTEIEYRALMLGTNYRRGIMSNGSTIFLPPASVALPSAVDWRKQGYVTKVKNQGACGSCWAFSATGSLEGQHFKKTGTLVSLSEQNLVDCSLLYGNFGCQGGRMVNAFNYIKANGIASEENYPYTGMQGWCLFNPFHVAARCSGYVGIEQYSESKLQIAVATVGPISAGIDADSSAFQLYKDGVFDHPDCSSTQLDHGVLVVGYGTLNGKDYWLVKNSWGTDWGMKGYIMLARNKDNQCGIATQASYPLVS